MFFRSPFYYLLVESGVSEIDILLIHLFLSQTKTLAEALEMDHLSGSQEFYDIVDIWVIGQPQNIVIGNACFLLSS